MDFGKVAVAAGLVFSLATVVAYALALRGSRRTLKIARVLFGLTAVSVIAAFGRLMYLCANHRFEFEYVFNVTSADLGSPFVYAATWADQQGSFLLWAVWTAVIGGLVAWKAGKWESRIMPFYVSVIAFLMAILVWHTPFHMIPRGDGPSDYPLNLPWPPENGRGLNPSLQNYWMAIHPPTIFFGFASLAVPFCYALASMIWREYESWAPRVMPWVLLTIATLGVGLMMGGYWAYETLGWHGFWAWDPVENASLFPWLAALGLLHGLVVQKSRGGMGRTNLFLAVFGWILFLYGTFLTRSGVLANFSVHSFANLQGSALMLVLLMIAVHGLLGIGLLAWRWKSVPGRPISDKALSRDTAMVTAVMLMVAACIVIGIATSWPMLSKLPVLKSIGLKSLYNAEGMAAQPIFFNKIGSVLLIPALIIMGMVPFLAWGKTNADKFLWKVIKPWLAALVVGMGVLWFVWRMADSAFVADTPSTLVVAIGTLGAFAAFANIALAIKLMRVKPMTAGGWLAHVGIGILFLGTVLTNVYEHSVGMTLVEGEEPIKTPYGFAVAWAGWSHYGKSHDQEEKEWWKFDHGVKLRIIPIKNQRNAKLNIQNFDQVPGTLDESRSFTVVAPVFRAMQNELRMMNDPEAADKPRLMKWPYIKKHWDRDFYVLVADDPKIDVPKVAIKPGEMMQVAQTGYKVYYSRFAMEGAPGTSGTKMVAHLEVTTPDQKIYKIAPAMELGEHGMTPVDAPIPGTKARVMLTGGGVDAATKQVTAAFLLPDSPPRWFASVQVTNKPWINLVWLGVILMGIGTVMAMVRRSVEARKGILVERPEAAGVPDIDPEPEPAISPNGKKKATVTGVPIKRAGAEATGGQ